VNRLLRAVGDDVRFVRSHTLQPTWYKVVKIHGLIVFLGAYWRYFGLQRTAIFTVAFLTLSLLLHLLYRVGTRAWTRSWMDFHVEERNGQPKPSSIGGIYYVATAFNAAVSVGLSQILA
jgi:cell division protein FtsW (lipid II flippase)